MHVIIDSGLEGADLIPETPSHFVELHRDENKRLPSEIYEGKGELSPQFTSGYRRLDVARILSGWCGEQKNHFPLVAIEPNILCRPVCCLVKVCIYCAVM